MTEYHCSCENAMQEVFRNARYDNVNKVFTLFLVTPDKEKSRTMSYQFLIVVSSDWWAGRINPRQDPSANP